MSEITCASCYFFYPCPCGECSYGTCGNTKSSWLHEYVYEDMSSCEVCAPMTDDAKSAWERLTNAQPQRLRGEGKS